jgi:hypothetical protein
MDEQKKKGHKEKGQIYKSLLVWDILLKKTDENHALRLVDIKEHLKRYGNRRACSWLDMDFSRSWMLRQ